MTISTAYSRNSTVYATSSLYLFETFASDYKSLRIFFLHYHYLRKINSATKAMGFPTADTTSDELACVPIFGRGGVNEF